MASFTKLKRTEDKYIISKVQAEKMKQLISEKMAPSYPNPLTTFTLIKSTYLDTHCVKSYEDHINKKDDRKKMRVRIYGNNGTWANNEAYLEVKETRQSGEKKKSRARLWDDDNTDFFHGKGKEFLDDVHKKILDKGLRPVCSIQYRREAFEDPDGFRVTFDSDLSYSKEGETIIKSKQDLDMLRALDIGTKYNPKTDVIMEVKHDGEPGWFKDLIKQQNIQPTSFSKYAFSMYHLIKFKNGQVED